MAKKGLRSRLSRYGDEEFALFLRRGFLKGAGYTDDALERPIICVLSISSAVLYQSSRRLDPASAARRSASACVSAQMTKSRS